MKNKKLLQFLAFVGLSAVAVWLLTRKEKKSGFAFPDMMGGGQGAANAMTFTMKNKSAGSAQTVNLFDATSLTPVTSQNPNVSISSTPDLQYFTQTLPTEPKTLDRVDIRSKNPQQLLQPFDFQAKDANGQQADVQILPMQSAMQVQPDFSTADLGGYILDMSSKISNYTLLPGAEVTMIVYWQ